MLPLTCFHPELLKRLRGRLGVVEKVEWKNRKDILFDFLFFYVLRLLCLYESLLDEEGSWLGRMKSVLG